LGACVAIGCRFAAGLSTDLLGEAANISGGGKVRVCSIEVNETRRARVCRFTVGIAAYLGRRVTAFVDVGAAPLSGQAKSAGSTLVDAHIGVGDANLGGGWTEIVSAYRTRPPVTHPLDAFIGLPAANVAAANITEVTDESSTGITYDSGRVFADIRNACATRKHGGEARACGLEPAVDAGMTAASLVW
jgi:hypothetical protein